MNRYSKALVATVATCLLVLLVWNFGVHVQSDGQEREHASAQTASAKQPLTEAAGGEVRRVALPYSWLEEPGIEGGVRVERQAGDHVASFVGTHLLAKLRPGATVDEVQRFLAHAGLGTVIDERDGLLKIAPAALTLSSFMRLQSALDADAEGLFLYSEPDYIYRTAIVPNDPGLNDELSWHFESIHAFDGWDVRRSAATVVVAVVDTGLTHTSSEFAGNIWSNNGQVGYDFVNGDSLPEDESGHGTAVAGLIGARANNGMGSAGVAWEVQLMPVKVLNSYGFGTASDIAAGIDFAITNGARIINLSLGGEGKSKALEEAVVRAGAAGVALVTAAGNEGLSLSDYPLYPAAYDLPHNVQVGASTATGQRAYFSNFSEQLVDIFAPGQQIGHVVIADNGQVSLAQGDGTSLAVPLVSGALALIMAQYPDEPLDRSIERLLDAGRFTAGLMGAGKRATQLDLLRALSGFVPEMPTVVWPQDTVALLYGDDFTLAPVITSDSTYTLRWFHNEAFLSASMDPLRFTPFEPQHSGAYRVEISSLEGTTLSPPIILEGIERPPVILSLTPSMVVFPGTTATVEVKLGGIRIRPTVITWYDGVTHEKLAEGTASLRLFVTEPRSVYAHIQSPYGQVTSDTIEISLADFDWLDSLANEVVDMVPLALELDGPLALNPAYWDIPVPSGSWFMMDASHGAYFIDGQRVCRYDLQGVKFCSEPLDAIGIMKVVGGFVFLLEDYRITAILDRQLQLVNAGDNGMQVLDIAFNDGYFHILFRNPVDKQVGIRVTAGFSANDTVYPNLAIVEDDVLPRCRLYMADGAGIVEIPFRYLWTPGEALQPTGHYSYSWQHNGTLYRKENQEITQYDTASRTWMYVADDSTANRLRLGFGSVYKEDSRYLRNLGNLRQVFDGEHWRSVGYTAQYSTIRYPSEALRLIGATDEHFYAYQPTEPERPSAAILFSADGFLWQSTGLSTAHGHLALVRDQQLVVLEREQTVWMDNEQLERRPTHFPEGTPAGDWHQLKAFGNIAFLEVSSPSTQWEVYVSEDMATWQRTNLSRIPTALDTLPSGAYRVLSDDRLFTSSDLRTWQPATDTDAQALQPIHEFSLGYIRNGFEYSENRDTWLALPFSAHQVVENKNRIFFIDKDGRMSKFLNKVPFVDTLVHPEVEPVVLARSGGTYLGQAAELWIDLSPPIDLGELQLDIFHGDRFIERFANFPAYLRIEDLAAGRNTIRYEVVSNNPIRSGPLATFIVGSASLSSMQTDAVPWRTGWLAATSSLLYYSDDFTAIP